MEFIDLKMKKAQAPFGFTLLNIPIINLWKEFEAHLRLLETELFWMIGDDWGRYPIFPFSVLLVDV